MRLRRAGQSSAKPVGPQNPQLAGPQARQRIPFGGRPRHVPPSRAAKRRQKKHIKIVKNERKKTTKKHKKNSHINHTKKQKSVKNRIKKCQKNIQKMSKKCQKHVKNKHKKNVKNMSNVMTFYVFFVIPMGIWGGPAHAFPLRTSKTQKNSSENR